MSDMAILRKMKHGVTEIPPHPKSAPGDFYVVNGECLACGVPHVVAPDLVGWADEKGTHIEGSDGLVVPHDLGPLLDQGALGPLQGHERNRFPSRTANNTNPHSDPAG